jgi:hypothetical protein
MTIKNLSKDFQEPPGRGLYTFHIVLVTSVNARFTAKL